MNAAELADKMAKDRGWFNCTQASEHTSLIVEALYLKSAMDWLETLGPTYRLGASRDAGLWYVGARDESTVHAYGKTPTEAINVLKAKLAHEHRWSRWGWDGSCYVRRCAGPCSPGFERADDLVSS